MDKILIVAGEASGDLLGAHLYESLKAKCDVVDCFGIGGELMQKAGVNILMNCNEIAVVGGVEIAKHIRKIRRAFKIVKNAIRQRKPDLVILIDYPGFNLRVAKYAKKKGCKVFYYVSPQIWAWRYRRIHHIKKYVDRMAVLFAFEEKIYQKANVPVSFVGHPIADIAKPDLDPETVMHRFNLKAGSPIIGLFPGSRQQEVSRMLPIMLETIPLIREKIPDAQFVLPLANSLSLRDVEPWLRPDITVIENNTYNALSVIDAAIAVSGTVTLEIAIQKVPLVVIYKMSSVSFKLAKRLIKVPFIALCNLVGEQLIAKELIQNDATPTAIATETIQLIKNPDYRKAMIEKFDTVATNLGRNGASDRTADSAIDLLS